MTAVTDMVDLEEYSGIAVLIVDNPPVNALSHGVRLGLVEGLKRALADPNVAGVVLVCRGRTFIAGADIREFGAPRQPPSTNEARAAMENATKPVVAVLHGTALGGGLETALACHFRIAVPETKLGLPEVKLGILPGGGGTQRLPRLVGVPKALEMITSGEPIAAAEALELGLVDEIVRAGDEEERIARGIEFARRVIAEERPLVRVRDRNEKVEAARGKPSIFEDFRGSIQRRTRGFEAPELCIQAVAAAVHLPFEDGLVRERQLFERLEHGEQSRAQRYYFFAEREAAKIPGVPKETATLDVARVGILGCGTMGGGIAMAFADRGIPVTVVEAEASALERGLETVRKNYERSARRGRLTPDEVEARMGRIETALDLAALGTQDLVIEAVFEDLELKRRIFAELDRVCREDALLASNTSALDLDAIAAATTRPESVVGMHFFSPANVMKLLEVVRGAKSSARSIATAMAVGRRIGKIPVLVGVCPGFVGNRILYAERREAERLVLEGALPWDVDRVLYGFGFPMGPFRMRDLAGLDIGWKREQSASRDLRELLCERGRLGEKSGRGYYVYDRETRSSSPDPEVAELIADFAARQGIAQREVSDDEILERCLFPMVNEGARILEEGIALRASDIDVVWVNGYGWPVFRGGPMWWGEHSVGLDWIASAYRRYAKQSDRWQLSPLIARLAAQGGSFADAAGG